MLTLTKERALLAASALVLGAFSAQTGAQGYVVDGRGQVVMDPYNLCWRSGFWTPALATAQCDPDLVPRAAPPAPPPPPAAAPAPPPPPPPPPVAKPAPKPAPKPVTEKVTFAADVLFDFDKATLKPEGKEKMDDLASKIKGVTLEVVIAIGHTDVVGGDAYNQKLSVRRAEAVKAYMVSKGIEPNRIYTEGKGKAQQVKKCPSPSPKGEIKTFQEYVACLAPNRRVEVEVVGTRTRPGG
jgi:OOP family OmpA-OmpF porin